MAGGAVPVRSWEASSATVVSRRWWERLGGQWPRIQSAGRAGLAWAWAGLVTASRTVVVHCLPAGSRVLWVTWTGRGGVREPGPADGDGLEGSALHAAVGAVTGAVQDRNLMPGQPLAATQECGLVGRDGEPLVRALASDQERCGPSVGLERAGGTTGPGQIQVGEHQARARSCHYRRQAAQQP
jgi:hypothetical protein